MERRRVQTKYFDIKFPGAFGSIPSFYSLYKKEYPQSKVTFKDLKQYIEELPLYQLHVGKKKKFKKRKIDLPPGSQSLFIFSCLLFSGLTKHTFFIVRFQTDLLYLPKIHNYRYGLLLVDLYSCYLYVKPLKDKTAESTRKALDSIIEENKLFKIR